MNALHPGPTSAEVVRDIFAMHFPGVVQVIDLTYGRGTFWKWDPPFSLVANDFYVQRTDRDLYSFWNEDFRSTGWGSKSFHVVVFDPPFSAMGPASDGNNEHSKRYGAARHAGGPQNIGEVHDMLRGGIKEACRLATSGVIVKTQSVIESGKFHDSETLACNTITDCGWRIEDKAYFAPSRRPQPLGRSVQHFRNRPSLFLVAKP